MPTSARKPVPRIQINWKQPRLVRLDTLEAATSLPGKALNLMIALWLTATIRKTPTILLTRRLMARVNISRFAATDALRRLEARGLVAVWRLPGRSPKVVLLEPGTRVPLDFSAW